MKKKAKKEKDPVQEIRDIRDRYAKKFDYDLDAIFLDIQEREKKSGRKIVSYPAKKALSKTG